MDLGASTGGFCDVLLARGVAHVIAVDVGRDQLHARIKADDRVTDMSGTDVRNLSDAMFADVGVISVDLAFISLTKALDAVLAYARPGTDLIALVKPQFEVGRDGIGKGGIVRDPTLRAQALDQVIAYITAQPGWSVLASTDSPISGGDGNQESLLHACRT